MNQEMSLGWSYHEWSADVLILLLLPLFSHLTFFPYQEKRGKQV